jgi:hypothetical protein
MNKTSKRKGKRKQERTKQEPRKNKEQRKSFCGFCFSRKGKEEAKNKLNKGEK